LTDPATGPDAEAGPRPDVGPGGGAAVTALADFLRILAGEVVELLIQVALPAALLVIVVLMQAPAEDEAAEARRFLHLNPYRMIGTPFGDPAQMAGETAGPSAIAALLNPRVWANRWRYMAPSLRDTSLLMIAGLFAAAAFASALVLPAMRCRWPWARAAMGALNEAGFFLCSVPVFVAAFVIRLKVPAAEPVLYYLTAAAALGIGNLTLAEMVQMVRALYQEEAAQPYFEMPEVRGFPLWRRAVHRLKPYARAMLLSLRSKVPILFSSVVIIEIILSLPVAEAGGASPVEKGLGLVAREAAEAGDGITLLAVIALVALWIRAFSLVANAITYFFLWRPTRE